VSLIGVLSVFDSIHFDHAFRQPEEHPVVADTEAVVALAGFDTPASIRPDKAMNQRPFTK
jgi:hypothetical protein